MNKKELDFIYNSNMIENIVYDRSLYGIDEDKLEHPIPEITGHKRAFQYMKERCRIKSPSEADILAMHKLLTKELLDENNAGCYRTKNVTIGGHYGSYPIAIKGEMRFLIKMFKEARSIDQIWDCHNEFETIHPFIDGNGRTGRLILNWLMLFNKYKLHIVEHEKRFKYYEIIETYRLTRGDRKGWQQNLIK